VVEPKAREHLQKMLHEEITTRFPGGGIERIEVLQHGDDPVVEPGELAVRVCVPADGGQEEREHVVQDFERAFHREIKQFRADLSERLPEARRLEFRFGDHPEGPGLILSRPARSAEARALAGGELTPVMARLGPADLETLDTLITAGIAASRADAVRWTLARIRERPAYEQIKQRSREIEDLKAQF
jgi:hypothetical protein